MLQGGKGACPSIWKEKDPSRSREKEIYNLQSIDTYFLLYYSSKKDR